MASLVIDDLPADTLVRLKQRAHATGRSVEAEARALLTETTATGMPGGNEALGTGLSDRLASIGLTKNDTDELDRSLAAIRSARLDQIHRWVDFGGEGH